MMQVCHTIVDNYSMQVHKITITEVIAACSNLMGHVILSH